jgi:hypothetical protein
VTRPKARGPAWSANRLRWLAVGLFAVALVFSALAGDDGGGPFWALSFLFFLFGLAGFLRYRRALRREASASTVSDREEKTSG